MDIIRLKVPSGQVCHQIPNQMSTFICRYLFTRWIQSAHLHKQLCNFHCSCRRLGHVLPTAGNVNCQVCAVKLACSKAIQTNIFQKKRQLCSDCFNAENRQEFAAYNYETRPPGTTMTNCRVVFIEEMSHFHRNK